MPSSGMNTATPPPHSCMIGALHGSVAALALRDRPNPCQRFRPKISSMSRNVCVGAWLVAGLAATAAEEVEEEEKEEEDCRRGFMPWKVWIPIGEVDRTCTYQRGWEYRRRLEGIGGCKVIRWIKGILASTNEKE